MEPLYVPTIVMSGNCFSSWSFVRSATPGCAPKRNIFVPFLAACSAISSMRSEPFMSSGRGVIGFLKSSLRSLRVEIILESFCVLAAQSSPVPSAVLIEDLFRMFIKSLSFCAARTISGFTVMMCDCFSVVLKMRSNTCDFVSTSTGTPMMVILFCI